MVSPMTTVNPNLWPNSFHSEGKSYCSKTIPNKVSPNHKVARNPKRKVIPVSHCF